jgi:putative FmdB family regulatory protein
VPTYAYACESCGFANDEWLKVSAALPELTCPSCGKASYRKQLTAPAFQLKGSGWYVTDFRQNSTSKSADTDKKDSAATKNEAATSSTDGAAPAATSRTSATSAPAPSSTSATASPSGS